MKVIIACCKSSAELQPLYCKELNYHALLINDKFCLVEVAIHLRIAYIEVVVVLF